MPPEQRPHLWITFDDGEQRLGIAQPDRRDPGAADIHRLMMQAHQAMALASGFQRVLQNAQLSLLKQAMGRPQYR
ncbi:hypothetical protein D3C81_1019730 [compost metagenome]